MDEKEPDNDEWEPPWHAGAIGRIPQDDALVYRDDAIYGPQFYALNYEQAEIAAAFLNNLEKQLRKI